MTRRENSVPPGPRGNRLVGSAIALRRSQIHTYERAMREHGDVVRFVVGPPGLRFHLYAIFHPDGVRRVLAGSREAYTKGNRFYQMIAAALGRGLLTAEGPLWQRQRRLIQPMFTRKAIAGYADLMAEEAAAAADRWNAADGPVDGNADMVHLTLRVIGRAIFGGDVDRAAEVVDWAFPVLNAWTFRRAVSPVATPASWPTPHNRAAARAQRALYAEIDQLIAERTGNGGGEDLLSRLVDARDADTGEPMDLQQVRDEALIFLLAGHETTSTALTFTLHLLGRDESEQERVHEEIDAVLGGRLPTVDDYPALERTAMAIKEAMRLYPPAYATGRLLKEEDEIGGHRIPAGSFIAVSQWATHRHPEFWEDPETFDPGRFTAEREKERHPYAYFPFGGGPRGCIGWHFAMLEAVIAVAVLLQRHRVRAGPEPVQVDTKGITLRPKGALPLAVTAR
jgi:cytochrome P450